MGVIGNIFGGGSSTTTQQANLSPEQRELIAQQTKLGEFQLEELRRQRALQGTAFEGAEAGAGRVEASIGETPFDFSQIPTSQPGALPPGQIPGAVGPGRELATEDLSNQLISQQLERLQAGGQATPQETSLINDAVSRALAAGETDIERFQTESTERLREELAPQLGLRPSDTPILDRGGRVAAEAVRQQGQLVNSLEGQRAQALLNFPLERAGLFGGLTAQQQGLSEGALGLTEQQRQFGTAVGEGQRQFNFGAGEQTRQFQEQLAQNIRAFQSQLQQSAFANRLQLAGAQVTGGLGLAGVSAPNIGPAFSQQTTVTGQDSDAGFGEIAGGIGGGLLGLGALFGD